MDYPNDTVLVAALISYKVIGYQIIFGVGQVLMYLFLHRFGLVIGAAIIVIYTFVNTYGNLLMLQLIVQSLIFYGIWKLDDKDNSTESDD